MDIGDDKSRIALQQRRAVVRQTSATPANGTQVEEWQSQFFKTKLCPYHFDGRCINGIRCRFAHTAKELRPLPDLHRTKLCESYVKKEVCTDSMCPFAHDPCELRTSSHSFYKVTLCNFYKKGRCWNGVHCRFAHGTTELQITQKSLEQEPLDYTETPSLLNTSGGIASEKLSPELTPRNDEASLFPCCSPNETSASHADKWQFSPTKTASTFSSPTTITTATNTPLMTKMSSQHSKFSDILEKESSTSSVEGSCPWEDYTNDVGISISPGTLAVRTCGKSGSPYAEVDAAFDGCLSSNGHADISDIYAAYLASRSSSHVPSSTINRIPLGSIPDSALASCHDRSALATASDLAPCVFTQTAVPRTQLNTTCANKKSSEFVGAGKTTQPQVLVGASKSAMETSLHTSEYFMPSTCTDTSSGLPADMSWMSEYVKHLKKPGESLYTFHIPGLQHPATHTSLNEDVTIPVPERLASSAASPAHVNDDMRYAREATTSPIYMVTDHHRTASCTLPANPLFNETFSVDTFMYSTPHTLTFDKGFPVSHVDRPEPACGIQEQASSGLLPSLTNIINFTNTTSSVLSSSMSTSDALLECHDSAKASTPAKPCDLLQPLDVSKGAYKPSLENVSTGTFPLKKPLNFHGESSACFPLDLKSLMSFVDGDDESPVVSAMRGSTNKLLWKRMPPLEPQTTSNSGNGSPTPENVMPPPVSSRSEAMDTLAHTSLGMENSSPLPRPLYWFFSQQTSPEKKKLTSNNATLASTAMRSHSKLTSLPAYPSTTKNSCSKPSPYASTLTLNTDTTMRFR